MKELETLKKNMKFYRQEYGWSQEDLAARMNVSRSVVSRLETGEQAPELNYLISLSNAFEVSIDQLLGREDIENTILHEVYERYETKHQLSEIVEYLVKTPQMLEQLERLMLMKSKNRKHAENVIVHAIQEIQKIIE
ncbi:helix-turn-helix domain-containing protein [Metabacillus indicus]|uniref:helix-turn-helix domain-containing protein n=1 Tax=Metabacillus TaxID=2675233 RepID=UPI00193AAEDF|nr:helix-turn-helix transcriptional regulator [Metabacillus sp. cB07]